MVPLWMPPATDPREFGCVREATTVDGMTARYAVESGDYDVARRTRCTHTCYELDDGRHIQRLRRDWVIHWHDQDTFTALARDAGLTVDLSPVEDREFTAYLQRV